MDGLDNRKISWPIAGNRAGAPSELEKELSSARVSSLRRRGKFAARNLGGRGCDRREESETEKEARKVRREKDCDEISDDNVRFFFFIERHSTVVNNIVYTTIRLARDRSEDSRQIRLYESIQKSIRR